MLGAKLLPVSSNVRHISMGFDQDSRKKSAHPTALRDYAWQSSRPFGGWPHLRCVKVGQPGYLIGPLRRCDPANSFMLFR
jgi:hypothetical protein